MLSLFVFIGEGLCIRIKDATEMMRFLRRLADDDLVSRLHDVLAGRALVAVLALDVLEHLPDPVPVLLAGTNFQLKVWEALLRVPSGGLCSSA